MEPSKKKVLIDLSNLKHPACGFGQIAINYSKLFGTSCIYFPKETKNTMEIMSLVFC